MDHILRAIRQVGLPVLHSQGHNPRPKLSFSPACATGIASEAEIFDALCRGSPDPEHLAAQLSARLPEGLDVLTAEVVPWGEPSLNDQLVSITYLVRAPPDHPAGHLAASVSRFLQRSVCPTKVLRKRRERVLDARAAVCSLQLEQGQLRAQVRFRERATLKIRELVALLLGPTAVCAATIEKVEVELGARPALDDSQDLSTHVDSAFDLSGMAVQDSRR
jgi:radical SAM-linked protein